MASVERITRLMELMENWDDPMSVAVEISDINEQLPVFMNAWLTTPKMRRNLDIHLLFNDNVFNNNNY